MKRLASLAVAVLLSLSSCSMIEDIVDNCNVSPNGGGETTVISNGDTLIISGDSVVNETFIATSQDRSIYSSWASRNYGNSNGMQVGYYNDHTYMRGLISFNVTDKDVKDASSISLKLTGSWMPKHHSGNVTIELYPMNTEWNEGNGGAFDIWSVRSGSLNTNGATSNNATAETQWQSPFIGIGTDTKPTPIATDIHSIMDGDTIAWNFDLTGVSAEQLQKGFMVNLKEGGSNDYYYDYPIFVTSEEGLKDQIPQLIIVK